MVLALVALQSDELLRLVILYVVVVKKSYVVLSIHS